MPDPPVEITREQVTPLLPTIPVIKKKPAASPPMSYTTPRTTKGTKP